MASYLGRNVNLALLVIIIGVIVALVGTTVFFQRSLQNRTQEYQTTTGTLSECQTALQNYQSKYSEATQQVNKTAQDIRKYDQLYEQRTGELKETQTTLEKTQTQLAFERLQKEKFQQYYEAERQGAIQLNLTVQSQTSKINSLNNRIKDICSECRTSGGDCDTC